MRDRLEFTTVYVLFLMQCSMLICMRFEINVMSFVICNTVSKLCAEKSQHCHVESCQHVLRNSIRECVCVSRATLHYLESNGSCTWMPTRRSRQRLSCSQQVECKQLELWQNGRW